MSGSPPCHSSGTVSPTLVDDLGEFPIATSTDGIGEYDIVADRPRTDMLEEP